MNKLKKLSFLFALFVAALALFFAPTGTFIELPRFIMTGGKIPIGRELAEYVISGIATLLWGSISVVCAIVIYRRRNSVSSLFLGCKIRIIFYVQKVVKFLRSAIFTPRFRLAVILTAVFFVFYCLLCYNFKVISTWQFPYHADAGRVLSDFVEIDGWHYRIKTHPFYVLFWQSLVHLLSPFQSIEFKETVVRVLLCAFGGINAGLFSLVVSRILKGRFINVCLTTFFAIGFSQMLNAALMIESFLFAQTSILLSILYFSIVIPRKRYDLPTLLLLSLFVFGNNFVYLGFFGLFYCLLLWRMREGWSIAFERIFIIGSCFLLCSRILLNVQMLLYPSGTIGNGYRLMKEILGEEGRYTFPFGFDFINYNRELFGPIFADKICYDQLPGIMPNGWIWGGVFILMSSYFLRRKLSPKQFDFLMILCLATAFSYLFHFYYGGVLYTQGMVALLPFLCLLPFVIKLFPSRLVKIGFAVFFPLFFCGNIVGVGMLSKINKFTFGDLIFSTYSPIMKYQYTNDVIKGMVAGDISLSSLPPPPPSYPSPHLPYAYSHFIRDTHK